MNTIHPGSVVEEKKISEEFRTAKIFYWILTIVLVGIFGFTLFTDPSIQYYPYVVYPSILMMVHLALYWLSLHALIRVSIKRISSYPRWLISYFILQTLLITSIFFLTSNQWPILALYIALAGQSVGMIKNIRSAILVVAGIVIVAVLNFGLTNGLTNILGFLVIFLPMTFFMIAYIVLYGREAQSKDKAIQLLRDLEIAHNQLAEYAVRVENLTLLAERQRMARELHDTLAQGLAGLVLQLEAVDSHLSKNSPGKAQEIVQQAMERSRATLSDARQVIGNLRTIQLSSSDLLQSIHNEVDHFTEAPAIPCEVNIQLPENITEDQAEYTLQLIREGLTNAARHAKANQIWLNVEEDSDNLVVKVRDNGVGFNPREIEKLTGHFGLVGLKESARLANGTLEIRSEIGEGTELIMRLPNNTGQDNL